MTLKAPRSLRDVAELMPWPQHLRLHPKRSLWCWKLLVHSWFWPQEKGEAKSIWEHRGSSSRGTKGTHAWLLSAADPGRRGAPPGERSRAGVAPLAVLEIAVVEGGCGGLVQRFLLATRPGWRVSRVRRERVCTRVRVCTRGRAQSPAGFSRGEEREEL